MDENNVSSRLLFPSSYIYLIRSFIDSYCSVCFAAASSKSSPAFSTSSCFLSRSASSVSILSRVCVNCSWRELASVSAWSLFFCISSNVVAKTGDTIMELINNAVNNACTILFFISIPLILFLYLNYPYYTFIAYYILQVISMYISCFVILL